MAETCRTLRVSTAHQPCETPDFGPFRAVRHTHGTVVWLYPDIDKDELPAWMMPIMAEATRLGCSMLDFDCDAIPAKGLQTYEW